MLYHTNNLQGTINRLYSEKQYRPTSVAVLADYDGRLLNVKSRHGSWHLPQGFIEEGETVEEAFIRELEEELGIDSLLETSNIKIMPFYSLAEKSGRLRNGFEKGKAYFFVTGNYTGLHSFSLQPEEISGVAWRKPEVVVKDYMIRNSTDKAKAISEILMPENKVILPNFSRELIPDEDLGEIIYYKNGFC